jgi:hypothetical protein
MTFFIREILNKHVVIQTRSADVLVAGHVEPASKETKRQGQQAGVPVLLRRSPQTHRSTEMKNAARTALTLALFTAAGTAAAEPIDGSYFDMPGCDNHGFQTVVEEFGDASVFAPDEQFAHVSTSVSITACAATDDPTIPNALIVITNLTGRFLSDLYYVADQDTTFSNIDGGGYGAGSPAVRTPAFRIDSVGMNRNLIAESMTFDGILEPGETWEFIVQDYGNAAGIAPDSFFSVGMAGDSFGAGNGSAASIVRTEIPAPASAALGLTGLALLRRKR